MSKKLLLILALLCIAGTIQARNYTVSGYIVADNSGETMIAASIVETNLKKGTTSNSYGFYSITLAEGDVSLKYSCLGYAPVEKNLRLSKDTIVNVRLTENNVLDAITVTASMREPESENSQMSAINIPVEQIKNVPAMFGEIDLIKSLQLLPGVQSGTEGFTGFYVRGGGPDENLFLLDGVPVYNINHMAGFFSVFNADAIKNVTLYKGSFPARFGGRLSSVLDIRMNDGNNKRLSGNASIGLISSKINLEGPLFGENTTFNLSARRTYFDVLMTPLINTMSDSDGETVKAGYYFYDVNAKLTHRFSDNDRLFLSFYMGDDVIYTDIENTNQWEINRTKTDWNWGNLLSALRWNHIIGNKLFMNTMLTYTRYRFDLGFGNMRKSNPADDDDYEANIKYLSGIEDFSGKIDFDYSPNPHNDIKFGASYTAHTFRPGVSVARTNLDEIPEITVGDKNIAAGELSAYAENDVSLLNRLKMNIGIHYSAFAVQNRFYNSIQPRLGMRVMLADRMSLKAGYAMMNQYIHLLSNSSVSLPTDLWVPVTKRIEPMNSHQVSFGAFYDLKEFAEISLEGYYKKLNNLIEYRDGATFFGSATGWEDKICTGEGSAYGMEALFRKTVGKTTGWVGYTLAKTDRLFNRPGEELNFGNRFSAKYDRRHDLNIVVMHKFGKRIDVSAAWIYSTGNCATLGLYEFDSNIAASQRIDGTGEYIHIGERNNFRYPDYHRLDLSFNFHKQKKFGKRTISINVYNAYNRMNPFIVYQSTKSIDGNPASSLPGAIYGTKKTLKKLTLFPILPSISYTYNF